MDLSNLSPASGATKKRKRVGRGPGSGHGKTSTRGHKGRRSRSGGNSPPGYEGGQMPLQRRLPKRGFRSPNRREFTLVNLDQLQARFDAGAAVDPAVLLQRGLIRRGRPVKILGKGDLDKQMTVRAHAFSAKAKASIEAAGGAAEVITSA